MGTWESSGFPKILEFDRRGQNNSHWGVIYIIGKLSKCKCRKWACMSHLDINNTSYGKKKGRESDLQFDSWPLKVNNRPNPGVCRWSVTHRWKALKESYKIWFRPYPNQRSKQGVMSSQSLRSLNWDNFGTPPWESRDKKWFVCGCHEEAQRILYGGRWWLPLSRGRNESRESRVARGLSSHQRCSRKWTNRLIGWFDVGSTK
jgi:hypothetical protein